MKTALPLLGLVCSLSFLAPAPGAAASEREANPYIQSGVFDLKRWKENRKAPTADRISDEELANIKARHPIAYGPEFVPTEKPALPYRSDFYANSLILQGDRGDHTVVPEGAVIHLPEGLEERLLDAPAGPYVMWPDFLRANRSWLRPLEVTVEQAKGEDALAEELRKQFASQPLLVVGVYKDFPISVLSPPEAEDEGEPGAPGLAAAGEPAAGKRDAAAPEAPAAAPPGPRNWRESAAARRVTNHRKQP